MITMTLCCCAAGMAANAAESLSWVNMSLNVRPEMASVAFAAGLNGVMCGISLWLAILVLLKR